MRFWKHVVALRQCATLGAKELRKNNFKGRTTFFIKKEREKEVRSKTWWKLVIGVSDSKTVSVSRRDFDVRQLVSIIRAELHKLEGGGVVGTGEHLRRRTKRQSEKEEAGPVETTRRKRFANEERERIAAARATRREKPYADSSRGRTREEWNRERQRPVPPTVPAHTKRTGDARQPEMRKKIIARARIYSSTVYRTHDKNKIKTLASGDQPCFYTRPRAHLLETTTVT